MTGGLAMAVVTEKYCPICGKDVKEDTLKRFGEYPCSEEHAEQYVKEVRTKRGAASEVAAVPDGQQTTSEPKQPWWRRRGCCG
jgi:predicted nucleic acid-binding Zn ribbon protein